MKNESNNNQQNPAMPYDAMLAAGLFKSGLMYHCYHKPTKEHWCIIGISTDLKKVCAAGWPPSIADMKDCEDWKLHGKLTEKEIAYREKEFGGGWL